MQCKGCEIWQGVVGWRVEFSSRRMMLVLLQSLILADKKGVGRLD